MNFSPCQHLPLLNEEIGEKFEEILQNKVCKGIYLISSLNNEINNLFSFLFFSFIECDHPKDVWLCLDCLNIGCGRNIQSHALQHYSQSRHPVVIDLRSGSCFWFNFIFIILQSINFIK